MSDDVLVTEAFALPSDLWDPGSEFDPMVIAKRLVDDDDDHRHLRDAEAVIFFAMRTVPKIKAGRMELGSLHLIPGDPFARWLLAHFCGGNLPDFIMLLDLDWWRQAPYPCRVALVDHELTHGMIAQTRDGEDRFGDDGRPVWAIRPHDLEEFIRIVAKHGAWSEDIRAFLRASGMGRTW